MGRFKAWLKGEPYASPEKRVDPQGEEQEPENNYSDRYKIQVKRNLQREGYNWRVLVKGSGREPDYSSDGFSRNRELAIAKAKEKIDSLHLEIEQKEQRWEDV